MSESLFPGPSAVGQIAIPVSNLAASLAFYRDVLGLTFLFEAPPSLAFLQCGSVRLMLSGPGDGGSASAGDTVVYYRVDDLDAAHLAIQQRGWKFERGPQLVAPMPDHELWMAFLRDPDGALVGLMAERPLS